MTPTQYMSLAKAHQRIASIYEKEAASLGSTKKPRAVTVKKKAVKKKAKR